MRAKLKNERLRPFYNKQAARLRRIVAFVNRYPSHEDAGLFRHAIKEMREFIRCIKEDIRPAPPMPHVKRIAELADTEGDLEIMEWNDRQKRIEAKV